MDEIKLYNQAQGCRRTQAQRSLFPPADIRKSRATYGKRYGNTVPATGDYFSQELIRSLAEDDVSLMGKNFQR